MGKHSSSAVPQHNYITVVVDVADGELARVVEVEVEVQGFSPAACMKVGELLLEFSPGHFVAHFPRSSFPSHRPQLQYSTASSSASPAPRLLQRASPLGADIDAMAGTVHVYVLLPMPRLHTRLSPLECLTIARLLHNHVAMPIEAEANKLAKTSGRPSTLMRRLLMCSRVNFKLLQVLRFMGGRCGGGGAARVAPHDDQQESSSFKQLDMAEVQLPADDEEEEGQQQYTQPITMPMMKTKPWAPKLDTISEEQEGCS